MTADRYGPVPGGEYTALSALRPGADEGASGSPAAPPAGAESSPQSPAASSGTPRRRPDRPWRPVPPPQHGAWAFLIVPVLMGFAVAGASVAGWLFLVAWVCAYPVGYYGGRALTARVRRGSWTRLARRELGRAVPWAVLTAAAGLPVALTRPWLLAAALGLGVIWGLGLWVAARRGERSMSNDLLLVAQAVAAVPLAVAVVAGPAALLGDLLAPTLTAAALCAAYLAGSVIHVKSLLREAGDRRWHALDVAWHAAALVVGALVSPWWVLGFGPALIRAVVMRPGLRPGAIGGIEAVVAVLVVASALFAL